KGKRNRAAASIPPSGGYSFYREMLTLPNTRLACLTFTLADWCRMILPQVYLRHGKYSQSPPYRALESLAYGQAPTYDPCLPNMVSPLVRNAATGFGRCVNLRGATCRE